LKRREIGVVINEKPGKGRRQLGLCLSDRNNPSNREKQTEKRQKPQQPQDQR